MSSIVVRRSQQPGRKRAIVTHRDIHKLAESGPLRLRMCLYVESLRDRKKRMVTIDRSTIFDCFDGADVIRVHSALTETAHKLDTSR